MGTLYKRGAVWWIKYYQNGRGMRESSHSTKESKARSLLKLREGDIEHGLPVNPKLNRIRFDEAAEDLKTEYAVNGRRSADELERRIRLHLIPHFGGRRLATITTPDINTFILKRQAGVIATNDGDERTERKVSNGEINRELTTLKRIFNLAIEQDRIAMKPKIKLLQESAARSGFFEREHYTSVLAHLPAEIQPIITFAYITGWRIAAEVLPLEWRQIDFNAGEVRLDAGTTKNGDGRVFPFTDELRDVLRAQHAEHERLKQITPWVFWRMVAKGRGGVKAPKPITSFNKVWKIACRQAGCPGRIPHDLRRTAVRNLVRAGIPERVAMMMTGHKTPSVFQRYNIVSGSDLRDAARKLNVAAGR